MPSLSTSCELESYLLDWTITFLDPINNNQVAIDSRAAEMFTTGQRREYIVHAPGVSKAVLTRTRSVINRATIATSVDSAGLIEISPVNTMRFDHYPITLAPNGLLIEEARVNPTSVLPLFLFGRV